MNDFEQGNIHYLAKEYYEATECYKRFLQQEPENYIALHNLGIALCQLGHDQEALTCFDLPCQHNYAESWLSRGTALRNLGKYKEALITFPEISLKIETKKQFLDNLDKPLYQNILKDGIAIINETNYLNEIKYYKSKKI